MSASRRPFPYFLLSAVVIPAAAKADPPTTVEICHWSAHRAKVISVRPSLVTSHFTSHGDSYPSLYFWDGDGDGFGDASEATDRCPNAGYVATDGDCDDGDGDVSPAATEIPGDCIDNDCDGISDGCVVSLSEADAQFRGESDCDWAGFSVAGPGDVDGDTYPDLLVGAVFDDDAGTDAGAAYVLLAPTPTSWGLSSAKYTGEASGDHARGVAGAGDVNGDGSPDFLVSAPYNNGGGGHAGAVYLLLGGPSPTSSSLSSADALYTGEATEDEAGDSLAGAGDVDGDGYADLVIGAPYSDAVGDAAGVAYLVLGGPSPTSSSLSSAAARFTGEASFDFAGYSVAGAGDVDGDGSPDLLVGAIGNDGAAGAAYLLLGPSPTSSSLSSADAKYTGEASGDYAGISVAGAGDVDGDGSPDLLVGASGIEGWGHAGAAYLLLGPSPTSSSLSSADAKYTGEASEDHAGRAVAGAGDVDGDGHADFLVGAHGNDEGGMDAGAAYLVFGGLSPTSSSLSSADAKYTGEASGDYAGYSVAGAGDVDKDGSPDLLVGAYGNDEGGMDAGAAYLILGAGL